MFGCYKEMREQALNCWASLQATRLLMSLMSVSKQTPLCLATTSNTSTTSTLYIVPFHSAICNLLCYYGTLPFYDTAMHYVVLKYSAVQTMYSTVSNVPCCTVCHSVQCTVYILVWISLNFIPAHQTTIMLL